MLDDALVLPARVEILGTVLSIWNVTFLVGLALGYVVLRTTFTVGDDVQRPPRWLLPRYLVVAYVAVISAQLFAYAFDRNTALLPPSATTWAAYYLDPLAGPKTLYGALLAVPLGALLVAFPWRDGRFVAMLDRLTVTMLGVMGISRLGCFLQGCCYGIHSEHFGIRFAPRSAVYFKQLRDGSIAAGDWTLPVVPTQAIEALVLFALSAWCFVGLRHGRRNLFLPAAAVYSLCRFTIEIVRADEGRNHYGPLSTSQWIALAILGLLGLWQAASSRAPSRVASACRP